MGRALRIALWVVLGLGLILVGVEVGVFIRMNDGWVTLRWPLPQAAANVVGHVDYESPIWVLALGWIFAAVLVVVLVLWFPVYLTHRRHALAEIERLVSENADLRNLPIHSPAPLEDLPREGETRPAASAAPADDTTLASAAPVALAPGETLDPMVASDD